MFPGAARAPGGTLSSFDLAEPAVQVSTNGGATWTTVPHASDYLAALDGHGIGGGGGVPNPSSATAVFTLSEPVTGIDGIRIIGSEGGTASGGFLGVFELAVRATSSTTPQPVTLLNATAAGPQFRFEFDSWPGRTHVVSVKTSLTDAAWQTLSTVPGDGTRKTVTDSLGRVHRFYRVTSQ